jgi:hypothetical protein
MAGRMAVLAGLLAAVVAASAAAQAKVYKTPQEVFDAIKEAAKKGDLKAYYALVEPESVRRLAAALAVSTHGLRTAADAGKLEMKMKERFKPVFAVMDKHGLTSAASKKIKRIELDEDPAKTVKAARPLLELIKDQRGFVADMLTTLTGKDDEKLKLLAKARLKDVKIDGDRATGQVVNTVKGKERSTRQEFVKVGKGWMMKLDFTGGKKESKSGKGTTKGKDD